MALRWMLARLGCAALLAVTLALAGPLAAQSLPPPEIPPPARGVAPDPGTLADSLARQPECRERTNGCERCVRTGSGDVGCSTPGIACQPEHWHCLTEDANKPPPAAGK